MKKKKIVIAILAGVLVFTACRNTTDQGNNTEQGITVTPAPFVESEEPNSDDTETTVITSNKTLDAIRAAIVEEMGDNYVPNTAFDSTTVAELFGIQPEWYDAGIAEGPMISTNIDKFLAFHATEGNTGNIETALNAYRDTIIADTMQYPMNLLKTQGCIVKTIGDYIFFVMVGFIDETAYETEEDMIDAYRVMNERVIEIAQDIIQ